MGKRKKAFSLVELLVVVSTVSVVMAVLMPSLITARARARTIVCQSNLRQILLAAIGYADDWDGSCVPAASDLWRDDGGYHRWHGVRDSRDEPFDPRRGPLAKYLSDGQIKQCPEMPLMPMDKESHSAFEKGCGGYGYNMTYIGSRLYAKLGFKRKYSETTHLVEIKKPAATVMFADSRLPWRTAHI